MKRLFRRLALQLSLATALIFSGGLVLIPATVAAAGTDGSQNAICDGIGLSGGDCDKTKAGKSLADLASSIINIISILLGIVAVIMIIVGGFKYVTSNGDSNAITSARNTVIYALVGLIVAALAQFLVKYVLANIKQ
jgi:ABC-type Fe3+ transport system permease subunit